MDGFAGGRAATQALTVPARRLRQLNPHAAAAGVSDREPRNVPGGDAGQVEDRASDGGPWHGQPTGHPEPAQGPVRIRAGTAKRLPSGGEEPACDPPGPEL